MKKFTFLTCFLFSLGCFAQEPVLEKVWKLCPDVSANTEALTVINSRVDKVLSSVAKHEYRTEIQKLNAIFNKTHRKFLNSYVEYPGIAELASGRYDCLTATTLFADILSRAGYRYTLIETNYHIFIVVNTSVGDVVLETTDRFGGFVTDKKKMNERLSEYKKNDLSSSTPSHFKYNFSLYQSVNTDQLAGLLYFNQAVKAFNAHQWLECSEKLAVSSAKYRSPRIVELATVLYHSIAVSDLDEEVKSSIMNRWKSVVHQDMPVASR